MISTEEFQQTLQAGQIQAALTLLIQSGFANELDVTTKMTEDSTSSREYFHTKINLLTGEIQNAVGKDLTIDSPSSLKLQQLHLNQVVASYRIVQDYLDRIKAILTILSPTTSLPDGDLIVGSDRLNPDSLVVQSTQSSIDNPDRQRFAATPTLSNSAALSPQQSTPLTSKAININPSVDTVITDSGIDLSIDEDREVWEEWVEDEDFSSTALPQPSVVSPPLKIADWEEHSVRRHLNPTIEVKPMIPRSNTESAHPTAQWEKFVPEYIGISADPQPQFGSSNDPHQMDKLLADLDL